MRCGWVGRCGGSAGTAAWTALYCFAHSPMPHLPPALTTEGLRRPASAPSPAPPPSHLCLLHRLHRHCAACSYRHCTALYRRADVAIEAADYVLMRSDLEDVLVAIDLRWVAVPLLLALPAAPSIIIIIIITVGV